MNDRDLLQAAIVTGFLLGFLGACFLFWIVLRVMEAML